MRKLYQTLLQQLGNIREIKLIDFNTGQLELLSENLRPPILLPAALIDIDLVDCEDVSDKKQQVTAQITIKIVFELQIPTDNNISSFRLNDALNNIDLVDKIHQQLQGFCTDEFSKFSRKSLITNRQFAGLRVFDLLYETTFEE